jgi:hypothetical protein
VTKTGQRLLEMFFQQEPCVIGADGDTHGRRLYYEVPRSTFRVQSAGSQATNRVRLNLEP